MPDFNAFTLHTTWVLPSVLGLASVANAPENEKAETFVREGFGVLGGFVGAEAGAYTGAAIIGGLATIGLVCTGPTGVFITFIVVAGSATIGGFYGSEIAKGAVDFIQNNSVKIFDSVEELWEKYL